MDILNEKSVSNLTRQNLPLTQYFAISATFFIALLIISLVGFANPEVIHNAAHDIRHSMIFPCH